MRVVLSLSFFILLMSLGIYSKAQLAGAYNVYYFRFNMDPSYYTDGNYAGIPYEGSTWFNTQFIPARITLFSGEVIEDGQFKLNLYNGRIFTEDNQKQLIVLTSAVKRLEFLNDGKRAAVFQAGFPKLINSVGIVFIRSLLKVKPNYSNLFDTLILIGCNMGKVLLLK